MKPVYKLSSNQARDFFLKSENYCNIDLPKYFNFQPLLDAISEELNKTPLSSRYNKDLKPKDDSNVNYRILGNKDGLYAWRPYDLINPALYVNLVHLITEKNNWSQIADRFNEFSSRNIIECRSIPHKPTKSTSQKGTQILQWWEGVEQESISLSLKFSHLIDADISDCYGSIYTHSISWAMHGKDKSRDDRRNLKLLGSKIDDRIQEMRYRQTNGIPQGNSLSDFIAEIVLGYIDSIITDKIEAHSPTINPKDFHIVRYRDDYRVFTNNPKTSRLLIRYISETLTEFGMRLNTEKTKESSDPILASVKEDKIDELFVTPQTNNYSKWLLQIYASINKHPNSGKSVRLLGAFHKHLHSRYKSKVKLHTYEKPEVMISIVVNLAIKNPRTYPWSVAIVSILLQYIPKSYRSKNISTILKKFEDTPNTNLLYVWLQRATYISNPRRRYKENLCKLVAAKKYPGNSTIWSLDWLADNNLKKMINQTSIIDKNVLTNLDEVIVRAETNALRKHPT